MQGLTCRHKFVLIIPSHLHVFLFHGLIVRGVLCKMAVGGTQVVDVACASLHSRGVLHQIGLLARRQSRGLEPQQFCNILLYRDSMEGYITEKISCVNTKCSDMCGKRKKSP